MNLAQLASSFKSTAIKVRGTTMVVGAKAHATTVRAVRSTAPARTRQPEMGRVGPYTGKVKPTRTGKYPVVMKDGERVFLWFETSTESWYRMTDVSGAVKYKRISAFHIESWSGLSKDAYRHEKACADNENRRQGNYWPGVAELG